MVEFIDPYMFGKPVYWMAVHATCRFGEGPSVEGLVAGCRNVETFFAGEAWAAADGTAVFCTREVGVLERGLPSFSFESRSTASEDFFRAGAALPGGLASSP